MGTGRRRRARRSPNGDRVAGLPRRPDWRRAVRAGGADGHAARQAADRPHGRGRPPRFAESHSRDVGGFLRRASDATEMRTLGWIALNGFRESVRDKVLYSLVVFAILLIGASYLLGQLTAGQDFKIMKDLGLSSISIFGLFIAVFIGIGLVSKEVERRSIYGLLAKPVRRHEIVLGKFAGLVLTLAVNVAVMTLALYAVLAYVGAADDELVRKAREAPALDPALIKAVVLILVQLMIVTAIALFFSTFSTPIVSAGLTFGLYVAGYFSQDLRNLDQVVGSKAAQNLARGLYYVLPNLAPFDVASQVVHGLPVTWQYMSLTITYGLVYIAILLVVGATIFSRRDFK